MAELLHPRGGSRGLSPRLRAWWAMRCQKRRRARGGPVPVPAAPQIVFGEAVPSNDYEGWFDLSILWAPYPHGSFPVGEMEIWGHHGWGPPAYVLVGTQPSWPERLFTHEKAVEGEDAWTYKVRYRNGSVYGPFSNEFLVESSV
ncbi:MAG TPA: hypothetical protein PLN97_13510 [Verrucomicrobiota bacterium]|nr:hypothetical protein [Verrucomicrobiota bacterium]